MLSGAECFSHSAPDLLEDAMNIETLRPRARVERGAKNNLCDVPGVRVGHFTQAEGDRQTGVTVILPCAENPFFSKLPCASFVLNGFGKSLGLVQIDEPVSYTHLDVYKRRSLWFPHCTPLQFAAALAILPPPRMPRASLRAYFPLPPARRRNTQKSRPPQRLSLIHI